jgi:hypothetical protein
LEENANFDYHVATALLFGAPNNSNCPFDPEVLEVDHITEGKEDKSVEMQKNEWDTPSQRKSCNLDWIHETHKNTNHAPTHWL